MGKQKQSSKPDLANSLEKLQAAGFQIQDLGSGRMLLRKGCYGTVVPANGMIRFAVRPGLVQGKAILHLIDRGFQKFWQDGARQIPARAEELKGLHQFENDLRAVLGETTLYNEALGTVSSRYVYDRVEGREGGKHHESFD